MTDPEKMRKLFDAALRAPAESEAIRPTPAVFTPTAVAPIAQQAPAPVPVQSAIEPIVPETTSMPALQPGNAGLDEATSTELGALLDAQNQRNRRKRRRDSWIAALVLLGLTGGGYGWFIQSPQRVKAFHEAIGDIRSVGDVGSLVAKYNKSLDKIKARSAQIEDATTTLGVDPAKDDGKDPYFETEMKEMTGGEGKTTGERNRLLKQKFGTVDQNGDLGGSPK